LVHIDVAHGFSGFILNKCFRSVLIKLLTLINLSNLKIIRHASALIFQVLHIVILMLSDWNLIVLTHFDLIIFLLIRLSQTFRTIKLRNLQLILQIIFLSFLIYTLWINWIYRQSTFDRAELRRIPLHFIWMNKKFQFRSHLFKLSVQLLLSIFHFI